MPDGIRRALSLLEDLMKNLTVLHVIICAYNNSKHGYCNKKLKYLGQIYLLLVQNIVQYYRNKQR